MVESIAEGTAIITATSVSGGFTAQCSVSVVTALVVASGNCGANGNNLTWVLTSDSILTISGAGDMADFEYYMIPLTTDFYSDVPWLSYASRIKTVVLPSGITSIGAHSFMGCNNLTGEFTIPNGITYIGARAFWGCNNLTTINFNATNCTTMGGLVQGPFGGYYSGPFGCTGVTTVNIGSNVTIIPDNASLGFPDLISLTIPNSVTSIGNNAFSGCSGLTTLNFNATNCTSVGTGCWTDNNIRALLKTHYFHFFNFKIIGCQNIAFLIF